MNQEIWIGNLCYLIFLYRISKKMTSFREKYWRTVIHRISMWEGVIWRSWKALINFFSNRIVIQKRKSTYFYQRAVVSVFRNLVNSFQIVTVLEEYAWFMLVTSSFVSIYTKFYMTLFLKFPLHCIYNQQEKTEWSFV